MKPLVGFVTIDRPRTTEKCIQQFLKCTPRDKVVMALVDNGSNDETRTMLKKYEKDFDHVVYNEWNTGCSFGINRAMSFREPGQTYLDVNADFHIYSDDWYDLFNTVISDPDIGVVAGRRAEFWIDSLWKFDQLMKEQIMYPEERNGIWCEFIKTGMIIGPFWMIKGRVIDKIGFMNEASGIDDVDYYMRVNQLGVKSCYIPGVFAKQPQDEPQHHPQYGSHADLLNRNSERHNLFMQAYARKEHLYCGTRFLPETMALPLYKTYSDDNWNYLKNWRKA